MRNQNEVEAGEKSNAENNDGVVRGGNYQLEIGRAC